MIRYFQRSLKYFISLCVLYFVMLYIMSLTSVLALSPGETLSTMLCSVRGVRMAVAMVVLALAYPFFGFMKCRIGGDIVANRDVIVATMLTQGFAPREEREAKLIFGADNFLKRLTLLFEDYVVMTQLADGQIEISGNRKSVAYVKFRLEYAIGKANDTTSTKSSDE